MPSYRRAFVPGGVFFFTVVTEGRAPILTSDLARPLLHSAVAACGVARPFVLHAMVLLPDHFHLLMELPAGDADFSGRLALIKSTFTRAYLSAGGNEQTRSPTRVSNRRRGVWQRWFWEHHVRDEDDFAGHFDYIHYNPVKHGLVACPHAYPYSTFARAVADGRYPTDWLCTCGDQQVNRPKFDRLHLDRME